MVEEVIKELTDLEKLKASNAEFEKELIKAREMKAEKQKIEAETLLAGSTGGNIEPVLVSEEEKKITEAAEFFKGSALGDAIKQANE